MSSSPTVRMTSSSDTNVLRLLTRDWERTSRTRQARQAFRSWTTDEPHLASVDSLEALLGARAEMPPHEVNAILGALLRIGDDLALRAFVQIMLPGIVSTGRYARGKDWVGVGRPWTSRGELDQDLVARAWSWAQERRGTSIDWPASTLCTCLLHAMQRTAVAFYRERERVESFCSARHDRSGDSPEPWTAEEDALKLVCDAVEAGILPLGCAQLLYRVRIRGEGYAELSDALCRSEAALKQQCKRAGDKLRVLIEAA